MTMKPKAKRYRFGTSEPARDAAAPDDAVKAADGSNTDGSQPPPGDPLDIETIRREGLTGRQLRMARRMAHKYGLEPQSDFDAVRLLRAKGLDPFQRTNVLSLASANAAPDGQVQLPQTVPAGINLPATEQSSPAERRAKEILQIQRDIARRRRRKLAALFMRLSVFIFLPTIAAWYYFSHLATPMYTTQSEFMILTADGSGFSAGGGLLSGTAFATGQDSIATQSYLQSKHAMLRLDEDLGFREHFSQRSIDPIQRLDRDASTEAMHKLYRKFVKLGYDPTEGVIRMELTAADPEASTAFANRLIEYAEENVDQLSKKKRSDAVEISRSNLEKAKADRRAAQERLVSLQEGSLLDPVGEIATIRNLIANVELQLQEKQLALNTQLANARPNAAKVEALRSEINVLQVEYDKQNARLNQAAEGENSLASIAAEIKLAEADLLTSDLVLQSALEAKRLSEIEANKQVRYLTVSVKPVASEDPSYPNVFENTVLVFLIFSGIYLLISLTASVLREQISS